MTDPFFQQNITKQQNTTDNNLSLILSQQKEIEENFTKLKSLFADPGVNNEQKQQIKNKLLELKKIYSQNKEKLLQLQSTTNISQSSQVQPNNGVHVQKIQTVETKRGGGKLNFNKLLLGCGVIFLLLLGGIVFGFYYMITHPTELKNIGMSPENVKKLLQTFTTVFFGIITILGFALVVINLYRLFNSKKKSKLSYILGTFLGIMFLGGGIVLGYTIMEKVNNISIDNILNNSNIIRPYLIVKDKQEYIGDKDIALIGPTQISFGLNTSLLNKEIIPKINGKINSIKLLCGNGQELVKNPKEDYFNGVCFYHKKIESGYPVEVNVGYIDAQTSEQLYNTINVGQFKINSMINIYNEKGSLLNNKSGKEILGGIAGDTVSFDASNIFKELGLSDYNISRDLNGDGNNDRENESKVSYRYLKAGVYTVAVRIPKLGDQIYSFPIRIEQSDIPVGILENRSLGNDKYTFSLKFFENNKQITKYLFQVLNSEKNVIYRKEKYSNNFNYDFEKAGTYYVKGIFVTQDGKQGEITSSPIVIKNKDISINMKILTKSYSHENFKEEKINKKDKIHHIKITEIPSIVKIKINRKEIEKQGYVLTAKKGTTPLIFAQDVMEAEITSDQKQIISIIATNPESNIVVQKDIEIAVEREGVEGKLIITPDTVGTSPFTIKFDASTSKVNDPEDEIVYFSRDFGDGKIKENTSESLVEHIYYYDIKRNNGEYYPKLKIKTKKGREYVIGEGTLILVKQPIETLNIRIDSHPGQIAKIGDIVNFSLDLDGLPKKIKRDFGDGKTFQECKGRECISTNKVYKKKGEYKIKVSIDYENRIPLEGDITLLIK